MAKLTSRGFNTTDALDFVARSVQPHAVQWVAHIVRYASGTVSYLATDIAIISGSLKLDSSDPHRRQLTLEIGGLDGNSVNTYTDPYVPFGQVLVLYCRIDRADGTWLPWLKQGEFPIKTLTFEYPSHIATVEAQDYSATVDEFLHLGKYSYGAHNWTLETVIRKMVDAALPNKVYAVHDSSPPNVKVTTFVAESGRGRWDAAQYLAGIKGYETFFDYNGDLVIRHMITGEDNETDTIAGTGPDIGTISSPVAVITDGAVGNLVAATITMTREGACNGVIINIHETADQKATGRAAVAARGDRRVDVRVDEYATGAIAWGDAFGRIPIVDEVPVKTITDAIVKGQKDRAKQLLHRRRGIIRYVDLDAVGLYWLEPDDKVQIRYDGFTENHYVQSVEFDLTGQSPVRIRTRQLTVTDPGPG